MNIYFPGQKYYTPKLNYTCIVKRNAASDLIFFYLGFMLIANLPNRNKAFASQVKEDSKFKKERKKEKVSEFMTSDFTDLGLPLDNYCKFTLSFSLDSEANMLILFIKS